MKYGLTMLVIFASVLFVNIFIGGYCAEYVVEFWGTYIKGVAVDVPSLPCYVAGAFLGEITIPAALVTWIISFIL